MNLLCFNFNQLNFFLPAISVADGAWHSLSIKLPGGRLDIELDLVTVLWLEGTLVRKIGLKMTPFRLSGVGCYRSTTVDRLCNCDSGHDGVDEGWNTYHQLLPVMQLFMGGTGSQSLANVSIGPLRCSKRRVFDAVTFMDRNEQLVGSQTFNGALFDVYLQVRFTHLHMTIFGSHTVVAYSFFETFKSKVCDRVIDPRPKRAIIIRYGTQVFCISWPSYVLSGSNNPYSKLERREKTTGTTLADKDSEFRRLWLPENHGFGPSYVVVFFPGQSLQGAAGGEPVLWSGAEHPTFPLGMMVANIRENNICSGLQVAEYWGPDPPKGAGCRRYLFLVYKQKKRIQLDRMPECARYDFDIRKFAKGKFWMKNIVAGNLFISKNSD
ncbi:protein D2 [Ditylenchus destructor]|uniref:Protein D2 n=1 Tax=Ditylenchus destructor TaxID=166010 RepID=A0AAD4MX39_9BILA|nr:protein D2 [Ditylenchus destructor]